MKISYNWLKSYIENIPEQDKLADIFTYRITEVESVETIKGDTIFDLKVLPDRAHDLLSHQGIARELAGVLGLKFLDPINLYKIPETQNINTNTEITHSDIAGIYNIEIKIETENCRRYMACIVRGLKVGPSPDWVVNFLESIGQRSINNIVDATNMVMYDSGQPTHAFDLQKIGNDTLLESKKIVIRNSKDGDELKLVGREGIVAKLKDTDTVISDGIKNLAVAGIKGGLETGVTEATVDILLEVANFEPKSIRKTVKRLNIFTDSAKRFENEIHPYLCENAMKEFKALIYETCPEASFGEVVDVYPDREKWEVKKTISFSTNFINKKLGSDIKTEEIEKILKNYGYEYSVTESGENYTAPETSESETALELSEDSRSGDLLRGPEDSFNSKAVFVVKIPLLRFDLEKPIDMVEEIAKTYGYDKINPVLPDKLDIISENEVFKKIINIRKLLISQGYYEVMTYGFSNSGEVEVMESHSDKKFLRTNLLDGLKKSYELNKNNMQLLGLKEIKIFEIGTVFVENKEIIKVAFLNSKESGEEDIETFLSSQNHIEESFYDIIDNFFNLHTAGDNKKEEIQNTKEDNSNTNNKFVMWSVYPYIVRDIACWLPVETNPDILISIYKENSGTLLAKQPQLFDKFTKNERTSYAYRLIFQSSDRTLTDEEINPIMQQIEAKIKELGFEIR